jgi:hypothetical protein
MAKKNINQRMAAAWRRRRKWRLIAVSIDSMKMVKTSQASA